MQSCWQQRKRREKQRRTKRNHWKHTQPTKHPPNRALWPGKRAKKKLLGFALPRNMTRSQSNFNEQIRSLVIVWDHIFLTTSWNKFVFSCSLVDNNASAGKSNDAQNEITHNQQRGSLLNGSSRLDFSLNWLNVMWPWSRNWTSVFGESVFDLLCSNQLTGLRTQLTCGEWFPSMLCSMLSTSCWSFRGDRMRRTTLHCVKYVGIVVFEGTIRA